MDTKLKQLHITITLAQNEPGGGSRSRVVDHVPGGGVDFFFSFGKNRFTTMVVNSGVGVPFF